MILLILFYFAVVVLAGILVVFGIGSYLRSREISAPEDQKQFGDPQTLRPLFAPSEEGIRALERQEMAEARKVQIDAAAAEVRKRSERARQSLNEWRAEPDRRTLGELLRRAVESENAEIFSEVSENVIKTWHDKSLEGVTAAEMADLLDSHFRLLPQQERAAGALFWLKQEIAGLRREPERRSAR
jgi:hypothetical protein